MEHTHQHGKCDAESPALILADAALPEWQGFFGSRTRHEEQHLVHITVGANESFDAALRRFNKKVQQEGIITETRRRAAFDKPSVLRKKKAATKRRKARRAAMKARLIEERAL